MRRRYRVAMCAMMALAGGVAGAGQRQSFPLLPTLSMVTGAGEVVSEPDGTATVSFTIGGYGPGTCKAYLRAWIRGTDVSPRTKFEISPGSGFPKVVALKLPRPGAYTVFANAQELAKEEGCQGQAEFHQDLKVKPHPDFPCSLYPGFRKESFGFTFLCLPTGSPANVQRFDYLCEGNAKFVNAFGYIFGCFPPQFFPKP